MFASAVAFAAVTFDPATGGFVGKGDVQLAFGWNNAQLQNKANDVKFSYVAKSTTDVGCEWYTGSDRNLKRHEVQHDSVTEVSSQVVGTARKNSQLDVTGFMLGSIAVPIGDIPAIGDACPGNPGNGAVVFEIGQTVTTGGLFVSYLGTDVALPNTP